MTRWRTWSRSQVVCRVLVAVLPVLALLTASVRPNLPTVLVVVVCSVLWASFPEIAAGPVALLVVMGWWAIAVPDPVQPGALAAALALVSAHVAGVLAAYGPARVALDRALVMTWVRRGVLSFVAAPVAYAALVVLDEPDRVMWPLGVGVLAVLVVVVGLRLRDPSATGSI